MAENERLTQELQETQQKLERFERILAQCWARDQLLQEQEPHLIELEDMRNSYERSGK